MADQVDGERAEAVAAAAAAILDTKDETVRGPIPLFNLKRQDQRQFYLKRVTGVHSFCSSFVTVYQHFLS